MRCLVVWNIDTRLLEEMVASVCKTEEIPITQYISIMQF
jgi:hypothetical protein